MLEGRRGREDPKTEDPNTEDPKTTDLKNGVNHVAFGDALTP